MQTHFKFMNEDEIDRYKANYVNEDDIPLWKNGKGLYKKTFSTSETWRVIREEHITCHWYKEVWFKHATPKYAFITWVAMKGRLATGDRMRNWSGIVDSSCVLCNEPLETMEHLFFDCEYSAQVWKQLMEGVVKEE